MDEFEIVVVAFPLSIVEKLNKSISGVNGDCLVRIIWNKDGRYGDEIWENYPSI